MRSDDRVTIGPPSTTARPPEQPTEKVRETLPAWAEILTGVSNELNNLKAQSAANAEALDQLLEVQKAVLTRISASEPVQASQESDINATFSAQLRKIALRVAGDDPSLAALCLRGERSQTESTVLPSKSIGQAAG